MKAAIPSTRNRTMRSHTRPMGHIIPLPIIRLRARRSDERRSYFLHSVWRHVDAYYDNRGIRDGLAWALMDEAYHEHHFVALFELCFAGSNA